MRISSVFITALLLAAILLAACAGERELISQSGNETGAVSYDNWQPQQSMDQVQDLDAALRNAASISAGGFEVIALDSFNRPDNGLLRSLSIERDGAELSISSDAQLGNAMLYLRSTDGSEHVQDVSIGDSAAISVSLAVDEQLHAVGITATNGRLLNSGKPLLVASIASGDAVPSRLTLAIDTKNNKVGINDQQRLIAQDDGEATATLTWRERLTGDYDLNGLVTISDITPIGLYFGDSYDTADPDGTPKAEVVDGDINGLINVSDLTPIGQNFQVQIRGYDVYRTALSSPDEEPTEDLSDPRWTRIENNTDPGLPSAVRSSVPANGVRVTYTFVDDSIPDTGGDYAWAVVPIAGIDQSPQQGPVSNIARSEVSPKGAPVDIVLEDPATSTLTVGDEFWVAVRITDVIGLFSANMRLEYDSSLLEVVEEATVDQILPEYTDGEFSGTNMLTDPLFIGIDNVAPADDPYVLLGFNDTQKQGTPTVDGSGAVGFIKFRAIADGNNATAIRWPQSSTFILMWGEEFGVPAVNPILGPPLELTINPAS